MIETTVKVFTTQLKPGNPPNRELAQRLFAEGKIKEAEEASRPGPDSVQIAASSDVIQCNFVVPSDEAPRIGDTYRITISKVASLGELIAEI